MYQIEFQPLGKRVRILPGQTLLDAAQAAGVELTAMCGGAGTCGGCRLRLMRGRLSAPNLAEQALLTPQELASIHRLACQAIPHSDCTLLIPPDSLSAPQRLQLEDNLTPTPSLRRPTPAAGLGLAFDLGTTKLAAYLVDCASGKSLARLGAMNPQIAYGEDVIARIHYANTHPQGGRTLQACLIETLNSLTADLCQAAGRQTAQITHLVAVGNTVMHHLFAGLPVQSLGLAPYRPIVVAALELSAGELGLALPAQTAVYLPPNIAGYIGGDHVAALLAVQEQIRGISLLLDIGTNTEISLLNGEQIISCSCASGPAFEGARIGDGMRAAAGAIERVQIRQGEIRVHTIGRQPPVGICGSGILDAIAELLDAGALDRGGNLIAGHPLAGAQATPRAVRLVSAQQSGHGRDILLTRRDIGEIQLAKGAIRAGVEVLLAQAGRRAEELDSIIVAGAFGTYLDIHSAVRVGLLPPLPAERFRQVGNAAGAGARRLLCDPAARQQAEALARRVTYVELASLAAFRQAFSRWLLFESSPHLP